MKCPRCERLNGELRRFCGGCGASLELACAECSFVNDACDGYCGGCGATLQGGRAMATQAHAETGGVPMISRAELDALLAEVIVPVAALPDGPIDQDDLDQLFGGAA